MPRDHDDELRDARRGAPDQSLHEAELREDDARADGDAAPRATAPDDGEPVGKPPAGKERKKSRRRLPLLLLAAAALGAAGWYGYDWWTVGRFEVSTDDAYVAADYAVMSAKVSGYVDAVLAENNAHVAKGEALVKLEAGDYRNALDTAEAQLSTQHAALDRIDRQIEVARAGVAQAEAKLTAAHAARDQAADDFKRYDSLVASDFASRQRLGEARSAKVSADAAVLEAEAAVASAKADVAVVQAQRKEAEAALKGLEAARARAERDLKATVIRAPFDGVVGNRAVAAGDYVTPGKRLLAVVPLGAVYVDANFKETQLARLEPGMPVRLSVDAYPDRAVIGHVVSVSPASGAVFSLLPPENATGNFTKVVQRVTVRISVPPEVAEEGWLKPGLSVIATAETKDAEKKSAPAGTAVAAEND